MSEALAPTETVLKVASVSKRFGGCRRWRMSA
jgi:hypothetical protein